MGSILKTPFQGGAVLAREGGGEMFFLDSVGAWIWDGFQAGMADAEMAAALTERFDLPMAQALADVRRVLDIVNCRAMPEPVARTCVAAGCEGRPAAVRQAGSCSAGARSWNLTVGDRSAHLSVCDVELAEAVGPLLAHLEAHPVRAVAEHGLCLSGGASSWSLCVDGRHRAWGRTSKDAAVQLMDTLIGIAERPAERLLSLHAGGVVMADGSAAVLAGPGGCGKTTLCAALNAEGHALLSDDVIPVTPEGRLVGLGLCLTVKAGSWDVLKSRFPALNKSEIVYRCGQAIRYVRPRNPPIGDPVPVSLFLFPEFRPNSGCAMTVLPPEQVLQRIAASNSVILNLSQAKRDALVGWVSSAPGYSLVYPDLDSGVALVRECFDATVRAEPGRL